MKNNYISLAMIVSILFSGCQKFLDAKPDKALATPSTLADFSAILNNYQMNTLYPIAGDVMGDDYYLEDATWNGLNDQLYRDSYVWGDQTYHDFDWQYGYNLIFRANVVLDGLKNLEFNPNDEHTYQTIKGSALFYRAFCMNHLLQVFTLPYQKETAKSVLGIPLKLSAALEEPITRPNLEICYQQVIKDLKAAVQLLPVQSTFKTQPTKVAAYAQIAREELLMGDFEVAANYADSALQIYPNLIDYNTVSTTVRNPFSMFNDEVIFQAYNSGRGGVFISSIARVDSNLYKNYATNDLRKVLFFNRNSNGSYAFKGDYSGRNSGNLFTGISTDELYLIMAESLVRQNRMAEGMAYLNALLMKRYKTNTFVPLQATDVNTGMKLILQERRKELLFRSNCRWTDIRRLSNEPDYAISLKRIVQGKTYELLPGDLRYANLIPQNTITLSGINQNQR